ncbi:MAG: hypothetical protein DKT66_20670 [Candidatus Melainabacteria bacterium]|nr:MAG: hypothetical protein DKT66_20670 [Candidatus Melainabacteria bacterium]
MESGAGKLALLFPGQGAHAPKMLDGYFADKSFDDYYGVIVDELGYAPLEAVEKNPESFNSHLLSSLFTILASKLSLERFLKAGLEKPEYFAGYSVGQFMAMHAASCFDFPFLVKLTNARSTFLDECAQSTPGAMLAIVGPALPDIEPVITALQQAGEEIFISNINCLGQYSLAGSKQAVKLAMEKLAEFSPKRLQELPVAGAWHCPLVAAAGQKFSAYLESCDWKAPLVPVINNVTGELLPIEITAQKKELVSHVTSAVQWSAGVKTLVNLGCDRFVEVGYGNVLTKFGFFIDRHAEFSAYCGDELAKAKS